jgi:hypothetical protein
VEESWLPWRSCVLGFHECGAHVAGCVNVGIVLCTHDCKKLYFSGGFLLSGASIL